MVHIISTLWNIFLEGLQNLLNTLSSSTSFLIQSYSSQLETFQPHLIGLLGTSFLCVGLNAVVLPTLCARLESLGSHFALAKKDLIRPLLRMFLLGSLVPFVIEDPNIRLVTLAPFLVAITVSIIEIRSAFSSVSQKFSSSSPSSSSSSSSSSASSSSSSLSLASRAVTSQIDYLDRLLCGEDPGAEEVKRWDLSQSVSHFKREKEQQLQGMQPRASSSLFSSLAPSSSSLLTSSLHNLYIVANNIATNAFRCFATFIIALTTISAIGAILRKSIMTGTGINDEGSLSNHKSYVGHLGYILLHSFNSGSSSSISSEVEGGQGSLMDKFAFALASTLSFLVKLITNQVGLNGYIEPERISEGISLDGQPGILNNLQSSVSAITARDAVLAILFYLSPLLLWNSLAAAVSRMDSLIRTPTTTSVLRSSSSSTDSASATNPGTRATSPFSYLDSKWEDREGWTTEGPEKDMGIKFDAVAISFRGSSNSNTNAKGSIIQGGSSFHLPCGELVVITGGSSAARSSILSLIWGDSWVSQRDGFVTIHGRDIREWNKSFLRSKITYLRDYENELHLQAGMVAGLRPGSTDDVRTQMLAIEASGARGVFDTLPQGPFTELMSFENQGPSGSMRLPSYHWRCLAVSRALYGMGKDIVLLDSVSDHMNEAEEKKLLRFIKSQMRPDQVVVIASCRPQVVAMADRLLTIDNNGIVSTNM